jgi:hypothetical protein
MAVSIRSRSCSIRSVGDPWWRVLLFTSLICFLYQKPLLVHGQKYAPQFVSSAYPSAISLVGLAPPVRPPAWLRPYLQPAPQNYVGLHNDLPALLKLRARENWITVFDYTLGKLHQKHQY